MFVNKNNQFGSIFSQTKNQAVNKYFIGYGLDAIKNTMILMKNIINRSYQNYYLRRWAESITKEALTPLEKIEKIFTYIRQNTVYAKDPYGLEMLKSPIVTLQLWDIGEIPSLDCDDYTILSLSLLKSLGFKVAMRATSYRPDKKFTHIYGLIYINKKWLPLDLTKNYGLGWEAPDITAKIDMEV